MTPKAFAAISLFSATFATCAAHCHEAALTDPLAWLYADSKIESAERIDEIDVPLNGVVDVNILLNSVQPGAKLEFEASESGRWYRLQSVNVKRNTGLRGFLEPRPGSNPHVARRAPFDVFDILVPLDAQIVEDPRETEALRFRMSVPAHGAGSFDLRFTVRQSGQTSSLSLKVNVHDVSLPPVGKDSFKYVNWMSLGSMAVSHGLEPWSEEHWEMIEKYIRLAVSGRQNTASCSVTEKGAEGMILNRARTERLREICERSGIWYFEGPQPAGFSAGWGSPTFNAAYTTNRSTSVKGALAISRFAKELMQFINDHGLKERWFQHVADEPGGKNVSEYRITAGIVRRYMPGVMLSEAVEEPSFAGALDVWIPKVNDYETNRAQYDFFRTNFGDKVWCYTCCIPGGKWMNRTMDGELLRPALIPWVSVMFDIEGFLHWGFNNWAINQKQDPFKDPYPKKWGSNNGNSLPPGDTHIVYPGKDGPWPSARLEATRAGMEDADLLRMLRARDKEGSDALVRRSARGFGNFTPSCKLYREVRRDLLKRLEAEQPQ